METKFEGIFELFKTDARRLQNGNKLRLVFESAEDVEIEKKLIPFRENMVKAIITYEHKPGNDSVIEDTFEVYDVKCRRLKNGNKLTLILEQMYEKSKEIFVVQFKYENCKIFLEKNEKELDFEEDEENE